MAVTLLLVDDDAVDREAVRRTVQRAGLDASIVEAAEAAHAIEAARAGTFDVILLDYRLPGTDGLAVLTALREAGVDTPVVALTGHADQQTAVAMMKAGAADYLAKDGLTPEGLDRSLRHAMKVAAGERERRELLAREQAALAEARAANRAKDEFLATLSHELRTPLNSILGWTHLLTTGALDPAAAARALETIGRNARLQAKLIDDLLDISRIVTGKLTIDRQPISLAALVATAVDSHRPGASAAGIELRYVPPSLENPVLGDGSRLQQVVTNLLSNALKFTPSGGTVEVSLTCDGDRAVLTVTDSGIGIAPEFLPYIFEQFRQGDASTTRRQGGLGLGLAIVRRIVELHDGTVHAESAGAGKGARFVVTIPLAAVPAVTAPLPSRLSTDLTGLSVLVVDDDTDGRVLIGTILQGCGAKVTMVGSADAALTAAAVEAPDVLLSDIAMPQFDGYALLERFRALLPEVPAAAISACASTEDRARALEAGFQAHLSKPIDPEALVSTVLALRHAVAPELRPAPGGRDAAPGRG